MRYDLVFEGGGAKAIAFNGALKIFYDRGHTHGRLMGTSAGAVTACLLAAGYTTADINRIILSDSGDIRLGEFLSTPIPITPQEIEHSALFTVLRKLIDLKGLLDIFERGFENALFKWLEKQSFFPSLFGPLEKGYMYTDDAFLAWFEEQLNNKKPGLGRTTLAQLAELTGNDLTVVASDISDGHILVLNQRTAPDCPVIYAIRMSMSVPFVWEPVRWQASWGGVNHLRNPNITNHQIVDGGINSNFPIELFLTQEPEVKRWMGDPSPGVLGFMVDETAEVLNAPPPPAGTNGGPLETLDSLGDLRGVWQFRHIFDTMMQAYDNRAAQRYADRIVQLPAKDYGTLEFEMTPERRAALMTAAEIAMQNHFGGTLSADIRTKNLDEARMIAQTARAILDS